MKLSSWETKKIANKIPNPVNGTLNTLAAEELE